MTGLRTAPRQRLRAIWGGVEGDRFWARLRGIEPPAQVRDKPASVGHSHVLDPQMRTLEGMRSVLFKLLAKAAMRMRREDCLARGMAIRVRFAGLEARFVRDLSFAPLADTPTLLGLLGDVLESLPRAVVSGRWRPGRHPPLSVAVTLTDLLPGSGDTPLLFADRNRAQALTGVLDAVNRRYGGNRLYFGAMQNALSQRAAPMRIPFQHVPQQAVEADIDPRRGRIEADMEELWLQRLRQFNVLAESSHNKAGNRKRRLPAAPPDTEESRLI